MIVNGDTVVFETEGGTLSMPLSQFLLEAKEARTFATFRRRVIMSADLNHGCDVLGLKDLRDEAIRNALRECSGNVSAAARQLGMKRTALNYVRSQALRVIVK